MPVKLKRDYFHEKWPDTEWSLVQQGYAEWTAWPANVPNDPWAHQRTQECYWTQPRETLGHGLAR